MKPNFLKSLFIQDEPDIPAPNATPQASPPAQTPVVAEVVAGTTPVDTSKTKALLKETLAQSGSTGFDYIKYKNALETMKAIIPDEKTRYVSSYLTAKTLGLTKDKLLSTANQALTTLENESKTFNNTLSTHHKEAVEGGVNKTKLILEKINVKTTELQKLTEEITALQKEKTEIEMQISKEQNRIDALKREFDLAYQEIVNDIKSDINKMSSYLEA